MLDEFKLIEHWYDMARVGHLHIALCLSPNSCERFALPCDGSAWPFTHFTFGDCQTSEEPSAGAQREILDHVAASTTAAKTRPARAPDENGDRKFAPRPMVSAIAAAPRSSACRQPIIRDLPSQLASGILIDEGRCAFVGAHNTGRACAPHYRARHAPPNLVCAKPQAEWAPTQQKPACRQKIFGTRP